MKSSRRLLVFLCWLLCSCSMTNSPDPLPGKIISPNGPQLKYFIYDNSDIPKSSFGLIGTDKVNHSGGDWLYTKDALIGTESTIGSTNMEYRCNIVLFDLTGKIIDRIYESENGELAWPGYSSWDDKYLIFTTHRQADPNKYPFEGLTPMLDLAILDLESRKVIIKIDSIARAPNFFIGESPWLHNGYQFVYSIDGRTKLRFAGDEALINPATTRDGIYLFDVLTGERKLLVPSASSAIASPIDDIIAYEEGNSIRTLDLNTNTENIIYEYGADEQIFGKHWTPDGKHIYFAYKCHWGIGDLFHTGEKLIEVSSGKEKPFKKIGHGFRAYSWK